MSIFKAKYSRNRETVTETRHFKVDAQFRLAACMEKMHLGVQKR